MAWCLADINWNEFDRRKVCPKTLSVLKAAALVEFNSPDYVQYLRQVFVDSPEYFDELERWGREERQHGLALRRWVELADPEFDFEQAMARFTTVYQVSDGEQGSVRGSVGAEMLSRCIVESATSFLYTSIKDQTDEPCLQQLCCLIARDEFQHYQMFLRIMGEQGGRPGFLKMMHIAWQRISEVGDEELASAFWASTEGNSVSQTCSSENAFDAKRYGAEYNFLSLGLFEKNHVYRVSSMIARPLGFKPWGRMMGMLNPLIWRYWQWYVSRLEASLVS